MPDKPEVQRRTTGGRTEGHSAWVERGKKATAAANETSRQKREDQWAPWKAAWEKESGKKYGIGTHSEFLAWVEKRRAAQKKKKEAGQTAASQGRALEPNADSGPKPRPTPTPTPTPKPKEEGE